MGGPNVLIETSVAKGRMSAVKKNHRQPWQSLRRCSTSAAAGSKSSFRIAERHQRLTAVWGNLPVDVRRGTVQAWNALAREDFEMDFSAVLRIAMHDEDAEVRAAAISGMDEDEDVRLIPQLSEILTTDAAAVVRAAAARALAHFVLLGELDKILPRSFEIACAALLKAHGNPDEDLDVRRHALEALAYTNLYGKPEIIKAAYAHPEEKMRVIDVLEMGSNADKRWAKIGLRNYSPYAEMRYEPTRACGELALSEAVRTGKMQMTSTSTSQQMACGRSARWGEQAQRTLEKYDEATI